MQSVNYSDKRAFPRFEALGSKLPGNAVYYSPDMPEGLDIRVMDVSRQGLGVIIAGYYQPGTKFTYTIRGWTVTLEVVWCQKVAIKKNYRRCGLISRTDEIDLVSLLQDKVSKERTQ